MWRNYICIWQSTFTFIISSGRPRHSAGGRNLHETFHFVDWETEVQPRVTRGWEAELGVLDQPASWTPLCGQGPRTSVTGALLSLQAAHPPLHKPAQRSPAI